MRDLQSNAFHKLILLLSKILSIKNPSPPSRPSRDNFPGSATVPVAPFSVPLNGIVFDETSKTARETRALPFLRATILFWKLPVKIFVATNPDPNPNVAVKSLGDGAAIASDAHRPKARVRTQPFQLQRRMRGIF